MARQPPGSDCAALRWHCPASHSSGPPPPNKWQALTRKELACAMRWRFSTSKSPAAPSAGIDSSRKRCAPCSGMLAAPGECALWQGGHFAWHLLCLSGLHAAAHCHHTPADRPTAIYRGGHWQVQLQRAQGRARSPESPPPPPPAGGSGQLTAEMAASWPMASIRRSACVHSPHTCEGRGCNLCASEVAPLHGPG